MKINVEAGYWREKYSKYGNAHQWQIYNCVRPKSCFGTINSTKSCAEGFYFYLILYIFMIL